MPRTLNSQPSCRRSLPHRIIAALCVCALFFAFLPLPAAAQIPVTDVAHIALNTYWHIVHYLQFALQIYQHYQQIRNQYEQIKYQLLALRKLANPNWRDLSQLLIDLDYLMRTGHALGYTLADAQAQFRRTFPGWQVWSDPSVYQLQTTRALDTMSAGLGAISRQSQNTAAGEQTLAAIRQQMAGTAGHQQALEQLTTLSTFQAQELLLTRQSLDVAANLQAVSSGYWLNREAQSQATFNSLAAWTGFASTTNSSPGWDFVPGWWPFN
jgi:P-type conjugative transfer protein TrbJ